MQDSTPEGVDQVLAMLEDQDDYLTGLDILAFQRPCISARPTQKLVIS